MKTALSSLIFYLLMVVGATAQQLTISNSVTYQILSNTVVVGASTPVGSATVSGRQTFARVQNGNMISTNSFGSFFQISLDNVNWTTVQTNSPLTTNATVATYPVSMQSFVVYGREVLQTTNGTSTNSCFGGADVVLAPNL